MVEKQINWEEITRRGENHALVLIDSVCEGWIRDYYGINLSGLNWRPRAFRQLAGARWLDSNDISGCTSWLQELEIGQPGILIKLAQEYERRINDLVDFANSNKNNSWSKFSNQELSEKYFSYIEYSRKMWVFAYNCLFSNRFLPDLIFASIAKQIKDLSRQNDYFNVLMQLDKTTEVKKEKISLLNITQKMEAGGDDTEITALIKTHLNNFSYLGKYYFRGTAYTEATIRTRVEEILSSGSLAKELSTIISGDELLKRRPQILAELNFDDSMLAHIEAARAQTFVYTYADEMYTYVNHELIPLFNEIAKRLGITYKQLLELRGVEVIESLSLGELAVSLDELNARLLESAVVLVDNEIEILSGEKLVVYKKQELFENSYEQVAELTGQGAAPGVAQGKVKLVLSDNDAIKVQKGDILLAPATNPTLVPAMERAAAIVTDEGGLLSHAAIVSRELGIPCLVGTKFGTKVFKDDDLVEVDTQKGLIKKFDSLK